MGKLNTILTTLLALVLTALLSIGGWLGIQVYQHGGEIVSVVQRINELAAKVEKLLEREPWRPFRRSDPPLFEEPQASQGVGHPCWVCQGTGVLAGDECKACRGLGYPEKEGPFGWVGTPAECCQCCRCRNCGCHGAEIGAAPEKE